MDEIDDEDDDYTHVEKLCEEDEILCYADQLCISLEKKCNYVKDCSDGSDEIDCAVTPSSILNKGENQAWFSAA